MKLHRKIEHYDKVCHAQELVPTPKVKVPRLCSRSQPGIKVIIKDLWGHLLHAVTFLVQEGQLSITGESMCTKYWLTA